MKKPAVVIIVIIALLIGGSLFLVNMPAKDMKTADHEAPSSAEMNPGSNGSAVNQPTEPNKVSIQDFAFKPETITVKKGTEVTWTNQDSAKHDVSPTSGADDFKASKLMAKGESYSFTFNTVGTYEYKCSPHPYMKGKVVVTE